MSCTVTGFVIFISIDSIHFLTIATELEDLLYTGIVTYPLVLTLAPIFNFQIFLLSGSQNGRESCPERHSEPDSGLGFNQVQESSPGRLPSARTISKNISDGSGLSELA